MSQSSAPPVSLPMVKQDIAADLAALPALRQWVEQACRDAGLDEAASYRLILAVDEIATNIVTHGYAEAGLSGDIALTIERTDRTLTVILEDGGVAYDPRTRSMPTALDLDQPLEERDLGGLGIFLALQGVDRFDYQRCDDRNRNILAMNLP
ncbi:MAG TPA: ATP-binding protein [Candidatus Competibacteraceae bacterium]|nr:ATP-binding protein [Candidatus Competibacteraceae bacterium]HQA25429.1 ATP-binding protein [Candidatus Competibacteraceae bacterium]